MQLAILAEDLLRSPASFEKLVGDLAGAFSYRISI
jgi:Txe/YoeB family toxin of Txe-Axe toxin-antitoxin module